MSKVVKPTKCVTSSLQYLGLTSFVGTNSCKYQLAFNHQKERKPILHVRLELSATIFS